jgi:hypothetical protein
MGLVNLAKKTFEGRKPMDPDVLRKAKPVRNPAVEWEVNDDGCALLQAPLETQGRGIMAAVAKRMKVPDKKQFELEPVGALVWEHCDGKHTVEAISRKLRDRYKMNRLEADAALSAFLQMLSQRRLITLMVGKDK